MILSHRWGVQTEACKTTTSNYAERTNLGTPSSQSLPEAFQDALWLARQIGVRYIWIDSICIVQEGDDGQDWECEALKMADYYQNALVTLATTTLDGQQDSPLANYEVKSILIPPIIGATHNSMRPRHIARLPYRDMAGSLNGYFYVYQNEQDLERDYLTEVSSSPLLRRGWVFQEWILSKRIVCFTRRGMFMLCQSYNPQSESGHYINPRFANEWASGLFLKAQFSFGGLKTSRDLYQSWRRLVTMYSALFLTQPEADHIIALAGIAKEFRATLEAVRQLPEGSTSAEASESGNPKLNHTPQSQALSIAYLAGNWLGDIYSSLLWISEKSELDTIRLKGADRIRGYPTWSWASHNGPVGWMNQLEWRKMRLDCHLEGLKSVEKKDSRLPNHGDLTKDIQPLNTIPYQDFTLRSRWDVSNKFAGLIIRARTQPVLIGPLFHELPSGDDTMRTTYVATDNPVFLPLPLASRVVTACSLPNIVHGWAQLDPGFAGILGLHEPVGPEDIEQTSSFHLENGGTSISSATSWGRGTYHASGVLALHISTRLGIKGGYNVNGIPRVHDVFEVIFLKECRCPFCSIDVRTEGETDGIGERRRRYERIGIGRLYGTEIENGFQNATEEIIELL